MTRSNDVVRSTLRRAFAGVALALAVAAAPAARAADTTDEARPKSFASMMTMKPVEVMHMMDKGNKGYVTKDEFLEFQRQLFERMDKNHDGKLSEPEFTDRG